MIFSPSSGPAKSVPCSIAHDGVHGLDSSTTPNGVWGSFEDFDVVLGAKSLDGVEVRVGKAVHLKEVVGKSTRDDGQEQLARRRADVAEGMRDVAGADGQRPRWGLDRTIAERDLEQTLQDVEDLGLVAVNMQRRPLVRGTCCSNRA